MDGGGPLSYVAGTVDNRFGSAVVTITRVEVDRGFGGWDSLFLPVGNILDGLVGQPAEDKNDPDSAISAIRDALSDRFEPTTEPGRRRPLVMTTDQEIEAVVRVRVTFAGPAPPLELMPLH